MLAVTINKILNVSLARVGESVHGTSWFSSKLLATNLDLIFFCPFIIFYLLTHLNVIHDCLWKVICSYTSLSLHFFNSFNFAFNRSSLFISLVLIKTYSEFEIGLHFLVYWIFIWIVFWTLLYDVVLWRFFILIYCIIIL